MKMFEMYDGQRINLNNVLHVKIDLPEKINNVVLHRVVFTFVGGETFLGHADAREVDALDHGPHVPAAPGYATLRFSKQYDVVWREPVVTWRVDKHLYGDFPTPITVDGEEKDRAILCPDGRVFEFEIGRWESEEEWLNDQKKKAA